MPLVSLNAWKDFASSHPDTHILQTGEWGELKGSFGWEPVRFICEDVAAQVLFRKLPLQWTVAYMPKPASNVLSDGSRRFWRELLDVCRSKRAVFLKVEMDEWGLVQDPRSLAEQLRALTGAASRRSPYNIQPPRTIVVDLRGTEEDVLGRMKQKCRYNIRLAEKKGIAVHPSDDLEGFHRLMQTTGGRDAFAVHSAEYYRRAYELFHPSGACDLFIAEYEAEPLAGLMVFKHGPRAWYLYGASSDRERNRMPAYPLQWQAMRWARAAGCREYDLWGVPDEDEPVLEAAFEARGDGLWGVYRFKRGFGGELRRAVQAVDVVFNPLLYRLYLWRMAGREAG